MSNGNAGSMRAGISEIQIYASPTKPRPATSSLQRTAPCAATEHASHGATAPNDVGRGGVGKIGKAFGGAGGGAAGGGIVREVYKEGVNMTGGKAQEHAQMVERLRAFLDVHGSFSDKHRVTVYRQLLALPENTKAHTALMDMGAHALGTMQLQQYSVQDSRLRLRLARAVHGVSHWCEALACSGFLPSFVYPWLVLYGRDECLCVETCVMFLLNWASSWFQFWPAPPLHLMGAVDRLLFVIDPQLVRHLGRIQTSAKDYAWPVLRSCFSEVLDRKGWLRLMDHILVQPPDHLIYILVAFLHHCRRALLSVGNMEQLQVFLTHAHPVDVDTVVRVARDLSRDPRARKLAQQMGLMQVCDEPFNLQYLGSLTDTLAYPMLVSFPKAEVNNHVAQYQQIKQDEERYLRQKKLAADMEEHASRLARKDDAFRLEDALLEQARQEQREQMQVLAKERRDRARRIEERARLTRLEQIKWMSEHEDQARQSAVDKQCKVLQDLDEQLADRIQEDEEWLQSRLEAERLEELEFAATLRLQKSMQERQQDSQHVTLQAEIEARRQVLEMQKRSSEQRWAIEDNQKRAQRNLTAAEGAQQTVLQQRVQDRMTTEMQMKVEEERHRSRLLVVEAQRQARAFTEEQHALADQRNEEQKQVEEVLAGEEIRHLDAVAKCEEKVMLDRMGEAETLIRSERQQIAAMKERRRRQMRALQARQRIEGFEKQVLEQKGSWRLAAHEHDRQVHSILLDLEEERRSLLSVDEEILLREKELRMKCDSLDVQRHAHAETYGSVHSPVSHSRAHSNSPQRTSAARQFSGGGRGGGASLASTGKFANISHLQSSEEEEEEERGGQGTPLEFTPKAVRRVSPVKNSESSSATATGARGQGRGVASARSSHVSNAGEREEERPPLLVGTHPPSSPNRGRGEGVAEAVVTASVGSQRAAGGGGRGASSQLHYSVSLSEANVGMGQDRGVGRGGGGVVRGGGSPSGFGVDGARGAATRASGAAATDGAASAAHTKDATVVMGDKKPGEKGYWQMRAALAGVELASPNRIKSASTATTSALPAATQRPSASPQTRVHTHTHKRAYSPVGQRSGMEGAGGGRDSSGDLSSSVGSEVVGDKLSWVERDVARARAAVASRFAAHAHHSSTSPGKSAFGSSSGVVVDLPGGGTYDATLATHLDDTSTAASLCQDLD